MEKIFKYLKKLIIQNNILLKLLIKRKLKIKIILNQY